MAARRGARGGSRMAATRRQNATRGGRALVERLFDEVYNQPDIELAMAVCAQIVRTPETLRPDLIRLRTAFPDFKMHIDRIVSANRAVFVRWGGYGTHTGPLVLPHLHLTVPPRHVRVDLTGNTLYIVDGDQIETRIAERDTIGLLLQLDVRFVAS